MNDFIELIKTKLDFGEQLSKKETRQGNLHVAYLNKSMIDACATDSHNTKNKINDSRSYKAWVLTTSDGLSYDDSIPIILPPDDEMMLYDEELSEYY